MQYVKPVTFFTHSLGIENFLSLGRGLISQPRIRLGLYGDGMIAEQTVPEHLYYNRTDALGVEPCIAYRMVI